MGGQIQHFSFGNPAKVGWTQDRARTSEKKAHRSGKTARWCGKIAHTSGKMWYTQGLNPEQPDENCRHLQVS